MVTPFITEFPVEPVTTADFISQVIAWLRGMATSTVLEQYSVGDLAGESANLRAITGEELHLRQSSDEGRAVGFRHDMPDQMGRLWRTEAVLSYGHAPAKSSLVRIRTQCLARELGARLENPRKPYFVKQILQDGWGGLDGALRVTDQANWLSDDDEGLLLATESVLGRSTSALPVVYISATGPAKWLLSTIEIEKLAYDLGGIAHVVVEPSRAFSFGLRDQTDGKNPYGGSIALSAPGRGVIRRLHFGWLFDDSADLVNAIRSAAFEHGSYITARGWDWTELQEQALRAQRERERGRTSAEEIEQLYKEEIASLQERIKEMQGQLSALAEGHDTSRRVEFPVEQIIKRIGPEIYRGELLDRLHLAARIAFKMADQIGLDERSRYVLGEVNSKLPWSPELSHLEEGLRRATKDAKRISAEVVALLGRHGYSQKSDNKHIRLEANETFGGLGTITIPKTPSDSRGLANQRTQIEKTLGLTSLRNL